jgi:hypothetical protein
MPDFVRKVAKRVTTVLIVSALLVGWIVLGLLGSQRIPSNKSRRSIGLPEVPMKQS